MSIKMTSKTSNKQNTTINEEMTDEEQAMKIIEDLKKEGVETQHEYIKGSTVVTNMTGEGSTVVLQPGHSFLEVAHKIHEARKKQWALMDKAEQIKNEAETMELDEEDAVIVNMLMDKIISIQQQYVDEDDY